MSSQERILSSRANGARPRGPTTPAGKQASSLNAIRHGILAKCVVLTNESRENFDILLAQHTSTATAPPTTSNSASSRKWPPLSGACAASGPSKPASTTTPSTPASPATKSVASPALSPTWPPHPNSPSCIAMRLAPTTSASAPSKTSTSSETRLSHQTNPLRAPPALTRQTRTPKSVKRTHFWPRLTRPGHTRPRDTPETRTPESLKRTHFCPPRRTAPSRRSSVPACNLWRSAPR